MDILKDLGLAEQSVQQALQNMNFLQGAKNFAEGILSNLTSVKQAAVNPNNSTVTVNDQNQVVATSNPSQSVGILGNIEQAISAIGKIIQDAQAKNASAGFEDGLGLLKNVFAVLSALGINVPIASQLVQLLG